MRTNFSTHRPAMPVFYVDATGAALGRGCTHAEVGSADYGNGAKQSRSTLVPLALYEGSDKQTALRENLDSVMISWNRIIASEYITIGEDHVPARPITAADMQGTKALSGQCSSSHATWCKCQPGVDQQHAYATAEVIDYEEMLSYTKDVAWGAR